MRIIMNSWINDIRSILGSTFIRITIVFFCLIPSVYSLSMIKASWNPYSVNNTRRLPIAIINNDEGTVSNGKNINIGNRIVKKLKQNKKIDWQFVSDWQGNEGLNNGKYYSLIDIPNDFSNKIISLNTDTPQRAQLTYQVNEKLNAAATKISSQVEEDLIEQIRQNLVKIGSRHLIYKMNDLGHNLEKAKPRLMSINQSLNEMNTSMDLGISNLTQTQKNLKISNYDSNNVKKNFNELSSKKQYLTSQLQNSFNDANRELETSLNNIQKYLNATTDYPINQPDINDQEVFSGKNNLIFNLNKSLTSMIFINEIWPNSFSNSSISLLENEIELLKNQDSNFSNLKKFNFIKSYSILNLNLYISYIKNQQAINQKAQNNIVSDYNNSLKNLGDFTSKIDNHDMTNNPNLSIINKQISEMKNDITKSKNKINNLENVTKNINEQNLNLLIKVLSSTPKTANIFSSPVHLHKQNIYNLSLLGYSVTPFYTSLSIWIGILLLTTIISWDYTVYNKFYTKKMSLIQKYIGKLSLFLSLGLIQTTIMVLGEILILGIHPQNLIAFISTIYISSIVFTTIIFSLVYTFGNLGKILSILLMLIQIFGTGGIYPIEIIPSNLSSMSKYLPFYYSIKSIRYSMVGLVNYGFFKNLLLLTEFMVIFILITPFRKFLHPTVEKIENGFKKSNL